MARCRTCKAVIEWALTERGARMPINREPDPEGTIVIRRREPDPPLAIVGVPPEVWPDELRYTSHFATCPNAAEWRRRRIVK